MRARLTLGLSLALAAGGCTSIVGLDGVSYTGGGGAGGAATTGGGGAGTTSTSASNGGGGAGTTSTSSSGGGTTATTTTSSSSSSSSGTGGTTGTPGQEGICNDGVDNDMDGATDAADLDCAVPPAFPGCEGGQTFHVYHAQDVPADIPNDSGIGVESKVLVPNDVTVARLAVAMTVKHPNDKDLTATLIPPAASKVELFAQVGLSGDDFDSTVLDSTCATPISAGAPPFTGCFKPSGSLSALANDNAKGTWTLRFVDDSDPYSGVILGWALLICAP